MIKHKIFNKGQYVQALISTTQQPNILIPVRGLIYDVKFDDINPQYQIRIKRFYDTMYFLKKNLFGGRFIRDFEGGETRINAKRTNYKNTDDLVENLFNGTNWKKYTVVVDSIFCTKTFGEQQELFNNLQTFMIEQKIKEIYELANRYPYRNANGEFAYESKGEFITHLKRFLGDRMPKDKKWLDNMFYNPTSREMDMGEWL
jgi:hypothetical protein